MFIDLYLRAINYIDSVGDRLSREETGAASMEYGMLTVGIAALAVIIFGIMTGGFLTGLVESLVKTVFKALTSWIGTLFSTFLHSLFK